MLAARAIMSSSRCTAGGDHGDLRRSKAEVESEAGRVGGLCHADRRLVREGRRLFCVVIARARIAGATHDDDGDTTAHNNPKTVSFTHEERRWRQDARAVSNELELAHFERLESTRLVARRAEGRRRRETLLRPAAHSAFCPRLSFSNVCGSAAWTARSSCRSSPRS